MPRYTTIASVQQALREGEITCTGLVRQYLKNIQSTAHLNAYVEVYEEEALRQAEVIDKKLAAGVESGDLFGVVISIKDNICYKNHPVTAGSKILQGYRSPFTATGLERLLNEDVIVIGRTNCDEFGMGSSNEHSHYGPVKNGWDESLIPGGSSGGAAVSVQTWTCLAALGTDTGGSVRQPAAFCGLWGYKPAYGRVSRHGLIAYGSSFDQVGVIAHTPEAIGRIMQVMAGPDEYDATCLADIPKDYYRLAPKDKKYRFVYFNEVFESGMGVRPEIREAMRQWLDRLAAKGHRVEGVDFGLLEYLVPAYYILTTAEASSNLARYDGVRYDYRAANTGSLEDTYVKSRTEGFGMEVKRRILLGTYVLSAGYYDAYFAQAQKVRRMIAEKVKLLLEEADFLILPVTAGFPRKIGTKSSPVEEYLSDVFTVLANLCGLPSLSFPIINISNKKTISLQAITLPSDENTLFHLKTVSQ